MALNPVFSIAIGGVLVVIAFVVALAVYPILADNVAFAKASTNVTGTQDTLLDLIPILVVAGLLAGAIVFLVNGFKGLQGND